eukprot:gene10774-12552_t
MTTFDTFNWSSDDGWTQYYNNLHFPSGNADQLLFKYKQKYYKANITQFTKFLFYAWMGAQASVTLFTLCFFVLTNPTYYYRAILAGIIGYMIPLFQTFEGKFSRDQLEPFLTNENTHFLMFCALLYFLSYPSIVLLVPNLIYSFYHILNSSMPQIRAYPFILPYAQQVMAKRQVAVGFAVSLEPMFMLLFLINLFKGQASPVLLFAYYKFLKMRYVSSNQSRLVFEDLGRKVDAFTYQPWLPIAVRDIIIKVKAFFTCLTDTHGNFKVVDGYVEGGAAYALFDRNPNATGWIYLSINTSSDFSDTVQASAAGYIEGYLTYESIAQSIVNNYVSRFNNPNPTIPPKLITFIEDNISFIKSMLDKKASSLDLKFITYWNQISLIMDQTDHMVFGYNAAIVDTQYSKISIVDLFVLNMFGDLFDIMPALGYATVSSAEKATWKDYLFNSHCSSLVKLTADLGELYAGHTTWSNYTTMLRQFKSYSFAFSSESNVVAQRSLFSSYPGALTSIDDFYSLEETQMVVMETTNDVFNTTLFTLIVPQSILSWMRVLASNRLSNSGLKWCETVSLYNSGTYNNQWIVVDYKKYVPYESLSDGALYILEQLPGYIEYADQTEMLRNGEWPSFNIPFYEAVYNLSGYNERLHSTNNSLEYLSYIGASRSQIFRRDANTVSSVQDFQNFLRYNDYTVDPLSHNNPQFAISCRADLDQSDPQAFGGTDTKMTSYSLQQQGISLAISGPTTVNLPPFDWNSRDWGQTYLGMPSYFDFQWEYRLFKSWVPLQKVSIGGINEKVWKYFDFGPKDTTPIIFIPGVSGTAEIFFKQMVSLCPKGFRIISVHYAPYDSLVGWCKGFDRFLDKIGAEKVHIFGTALGGYLAQCYYQTRPSRVHSLILNNSFCDTQFFHDNAPCASMFSLMPEFMLKRTILSNYPSGVVDPEIAEAIDFMVQQLESLTQNELASRLTLNCSIGILNPSGGLMNNITIIDTMDSKTIPEKMREEVYKFYPNAKTALLKTGGDVSYLSKADEINMHIQVHLRNFGLDPVTGECTSTTPKQQSNQYGDELEEDEEGEQKPAVSPTTAKNEEVLVEGEEEITEENVFSKLPDNERVYTILNSTFYWLTDAFDFN